MFVSSPKIALNAIPCLASVSLHILSHESFCLVNSVRVLFLSPKIIFGQTENLGGDRFANPTEISKRAAVESSLDTGKQLRVCY